MTHLHPDTDWLTDYAAGTLDDAHALCVATHLEHCPVCRADVKNLASIGGAMLNALGTTSVETPVVADADNKNVYQIDELLIEKTLKQLDTETQTTPPDTGRLEPTAESENVPLPAAFRKLAPNGLESLNWKSFGKNLHVADLDRIDDKREVALQKLEPGSAVAHHDHRGREITVVLTGSFSDSNGQYYPGDFIVKEPGEKHRPTASENTPCVCLSVTDAPVRFTGMLTRLLNPVIAYRHPG